MDLRRSGEIEIVKTAFAEAFFHSYDDKQKGFITNPVIRRLEIVTARHVREHMGNSCYCKRVLGKLLGKYFFD